jgi:hypothetical protein
VTTMSLPSKGPRSVSPLRPSVWVLTEIRSDPEGRWGALCVLAVGIVLSMDDTLGRNR